ncbi:MAG: dipeptidase [Caldicoprobacterales bacterium]|jgi:membrane dipeptidase|nr:membrane dipeptidase [Clostridiales bacterium]
MDSYFIIDSHCDTIGLIADKGLSVFQQEKCHVTLEGLKAGRVGLQFFAAFVAPRKNYPYLQRGLKLIDAYYAMLERYEDSFLAITKPDDIDLARQQDKIGTMLTVEGGDILEGELLNLRILYRLGVRAITLTWNYRNEIADGALEKKSKGGLSTFGHEVVNEMNHLGMLIDVSHLSEEGFYSVIEVSKKPVAATHSNAWSIQQHPRNLRDEQIKLLAKIGGIMGINFYPPFLSGQQAGLNDIISHIEYIAGLAGTDVIGFGSDFDGIDETLDEVRGPQDYEKIINALLRLNYSDEDIRKITYKNYIRLLKSVL